MPISIVVAVAENGVIGAAGDMPWRLRSDLKHFKAVTLGKPIIMGRKTWHSIGRALPGRMNIVISRDAEFVAEGATVAGSLQAALDLAQGDAGEGGEICIIGGGQIYAQAMALADRLYVTHIQAAIDGDTVFPAIDGSVWHQTDVSAPVRGEGDSAAMVFAVYERKDKARAQ